MVDFAFVTGPCSYWWSISVLSLVLAHIDGRFRCFHWSLLILMVDFGFVWGCHTRCWVYTKLYGWVCYKVVWLKVWESSRKSEKVRERRFEEVGESSRKFEKSSKVAECMFLKRLWTRRICLDLLGFDRIPLDCRLLLIPSVAPHNPLFIHW